MKNTLLKAVLANLLVAMGSVSAKALPPALFFSDIVSGPNTGNGDGLGSGAIVTIWGANLGSSQGNSTVLVGGAQTDHVYCWGNADGTFNPGTCGGPAQLYNSYQKMQAISFSIPAGAPSGATTISVTVGGVTSNALPFMVSAGRICYIGSTTQAGSDLPGNCSYANPLQTLQYVVGADRVGISSFTNRPGDIYYVMNGVGSNGNLNMYPTTGGTDAAPISFVVYPGGVSTIISNPISGAEAIKQWAVSPMAQNINFAKFTVKTYGNGIDTVRNMRAVGNEITNYPGGCADGQGGALSGSNLYSSEDSTGKVKAFGNYIHDFGCDTTTKLHHVFYISNRGGFTVAAFEIGWNYAINNKVHHGLHIYDEGPCGDWTGTIRMHDNVVVNQVGWGADINSGCTSTFITVPVEIFNNLFIEVGLETAADFGGHNQAITFEGASTHSNVKFYNNTIYGYGQASTSGGYAMQIQQGGSVTANFGGTWEYKNNILVDTHNLPYNEPGFMKAADVHSTNLYWSTGTPQSSPLWDTGALNLDPRFVSPSGGSFNLQSASPAVDSGTNVSPTVTRDILGVLRPQGTGFDIGAYEFAVFGSTAPSSPKGFRLQ